MRLLLNKALKKEKAKQNTFIRILGKVMCSQIVINVFKLICFMIILI